MSQRKKNRNKTGRRSKKSTPMPDPLNNTFCAKVVKSLGNCRFHVERYQDMGYIENSDNKNIYRLVCELDSSMKGGNRFNRVRDGDNVLIEEQSYSGTIVNNSTKKNFKIIGVYTKANTSQLKACGAFNQSEVSGNKPDIDEDCIMFEGENKKVVEKKTIDDDFINNI